MYEKRFDGRDWKELRPMEAKINVIKNADGSAYFRMGHTEAYAAVYGPKTLVPKFLQNPEKGLLKVSYWMMPFSGIGGRVRPAPNRRALELSKVIENALLSVVKLEEFPNSVTEVFVGMSETDAGSRCVALNAASLALAAAGIPMKDLITAVALGRVDDKLVVDLNYSEEAYENGPVADVPFALIPRTKEIVLLQGDGYITKDMFYELLDTLDPIVEEIYKVQINALLEPYKR